MTDPRVKRAASKDDDIAVDALADLSLEDEPPVSIQWVEAIEARKGRDKRIYAWCYMLRLALLPEQRIDLLTLGLHDPNPRIREFCADYIGDNAIEDLRDHLLGLFDDPAASVRKAASYNYREMF
ncbi:MAG TPA: hypothetical protein VD994_21680 [Prosthecobacter sp.]|nr:hypothetical protein [Prosthecobacter sp.]